MCNVQPISSMRVSPDVAEIAIEVCQARGLDNPRVAIEAIVRTCYQTYLSGSPPVSSAPAVSPSLAYSPPINASAALDQVL